MKRLWRWTARAITFGLIAVSVWHYRRGEMNQAQYLLWLAGVMELEDLVEGKG